MPQQRLTAYTVGRFAVDPSYHRHASAYIAGPFVFNLWSALHPGNGRAGHMSAAIRAIVGRF